MLKATIDKNENACRLELVGNSQELANDLCGLVANFTKGIMTKHTKDEAREIVTTACSAGIAHALKGNE